MLRFISRLITSTAAINQVGGGGGGTDTTPDAFAFSDVTGATLSTQYTSNTITVSGINAAAAISITGGTYSVNGGGYTSGSGTVNNGDTVSVRVTSSGSNSTAVNATLDIGGVTDTYSVTTVAAGDSTPDAFTFTDVTGATLSSQYTSNTITVAGINTASAISITGGTYSINGGSYTSSPGTVVNGDTVSVRVTSSGSPTTAVNAVLTIGGVSDTYTVTTSSGYSFTNSEAAAAVAAMTVAPNDTVKARYDAFVGALKSGATSGNNIWAKLDHVYILAAHDRQAARVNLKNSAKILTENGTLTFTTDRGFEGDGTTGYLSFGEQMAFSGANFVQDSASIGAWCNASGAGAATLHPQIGDLGTGAYIRSRTTSANHTGALNGASVNFEASSANHTGHRTISRTGATTTNRYVNGTVFGTVNTNSSTTPSSSFAAILRSSTLYGDDRIAAGYTGGGLNAAEIADLHNALNTFLTANGGA